MSFLPWQSKVRGMVILVALLPCAFSAGCSPSKAKAAAESGVARFHAQLDAEQYHDIYAQASPEFQSAEKEADLTEFLAAVHRKLGKLRHCEEQNFNVNFNTSGTSVALTYQSNFENGPAREQFVWRAGDQAQLINYRIDSRTLITK